MTDPLLETKRQQMLKTNERQKEYYDRVSRGWISPLNSVATNLWSKLRYRAMQSVSNPTRAIVYDVHRKWLGDLSAKKVLELGAGDGSPLSRYLAESAAEYHAIELSALQLEKLENRVGAGASRKFIVGDFLDNDTTDDDYDVIYAHAVLHHFRHLDVVLSQAHKKLKAGGQIVSYDPQQIWLPIRLFRSLFRPFQNDAHWEFPFTGRSLRLIRSKFELSDQLGVFNRGKWALVLGVLCIPLGKKYGDQLFQLDFRKLGANENTRNALHISLNLFKPAPDSH